MKSPIELAVAHMRENYSEPLSLAEIASSAMLSRFHFSRVFRDATGVSPGRFLSAIRIYEAKRMLASTSRTVTDISMAVGYNSLGSFTNRFTESVGLSPSQFRRLWRGGVRAVPDLLRATEAEQSGRLKSGSPESGSPESGSPESGPTEPEPGGPSSLGAIAGRVELPARYAAAWVYLGAFATPIVQGRPAASVTLRTWPGQPASYRLSGIPAGEWHLRAVAVADSADPEPWTSRSLLVAGQGSVPVTPGAVSPRVLTLRPRRPIDLPILLAVPDLELAGARDEQAPESAPPAAGVTARIPVRRAPAPVAWSDCRRA
jgi:AraC family transcriptional regulator